MRARPNAMATLIRPAGSATLRRAGAPTQRSAEALRLFVLALRHALAALPSQGSRP